MEVQVENRGAVTIVKLVGELDSQTSGMVREKINSLLQKGNIKILFDLGELVFMNSSGLGVIVSSSMAVKRDGGIMKVCNLHKNVQRVFQLTQMNKAFEIWPTVDEALKNF
jgi:anti-anti-sigma factor